MTPPLPPLDDVVAHIARHTGLSTASRRAGLEDSIRRAMARAGVSDPTAYLDLLGHDTGALDDLLEGLTVGETYFFREPGQFAFLRHTVLPEFRRRGRRPRAWSAGCATGEEAYSLAILFEQEGLGDAGAILATDLCRSALERARRGVYRPWSLRGEAAALAQPYLEAAGKCLRVSAAVRRLVTFRPLNLALDDYPSVSTGTAALDLILCRNVLIYFDAETVRRVAARLRAALVPGGWLLTASSDPPLAELAPFAAVVTPHGVVYRRPASDSAGPGAPAEAPAILTTNFPGLNGPEEALALPASEPPPPVREPIRAPDLTAQAQAALARGDYARALQLTEGADADVALAAVRVRALSGLGSGEAERACAAAVARHPLAAELSYLHALLLLDLGRDAEAAQALRRVLYLDGALAVAHFTLGSVLERLGDVAGAARAYRNALGLSHARPPDEALPLADGGQAGPLAEVTAARLARLEEPEGRSA
jgi:chemotaxis protein methyltransferase CheR